MTSDRIIVILLFGLNAAVFIWGLYQQSKGNSAIAASQLISQIESSDLLGPEKMAYVVGKLYELIPAPLKGVLDKVTLEVLAQKIFDYSRKYANAYAEAKAGKGKAAYEPVNDELAKDVSDKLSQLGDVGLKALAVNLGIETAGLEKAEIIKQIVLMIMDRV